jgi:hypothetical protein
MASGMAMRSGKGGSEQSRQANGKRGLRIAQYRDGATEGKLISRRFVQLSPIELIIYGCFVLNRHFSSGLILDFISDGI